MAKTWGKREPLIEAHIKDVSIGAIEKHLESFREFVGHGKSGIYVLRKNRDVYYVGLASSLRKRIADHLKDRHKGEWNRFDLYFTRRGKSKYLADLEALGIRVAKPRGCRTEPNFVKSKNRTKEFKTALHRKVDEMFSDLS